MSRTSSTSDEEELRERQDVVREVDFWVAFREEIEKEENGDCSETSDGETVDGESPQDRLFSGLQIRVSNPLVPIVDVSQASIPSTPGTSSSVPSTAASGTSTPIACDLSNLKSFDYNEVFSLIKDQLGMPADSVLKTIPSFRYPDLLVKIENNRYKIVIQLIKMEALGLKGTREQRRFVLRHLGEIENILLEKARIAEQTTFSLDQGSMVPRSHCTSCNLTHTDMHPDCTNSTVHGPQTMEDLQVGTNWLTEAEAAFIGTSRIVYLPPSQKGKIVNLGLYQGEDLTYPVGVEKKHMYQLPDYPYHANRQPLVKVLDDRLVLLAKDKRRIPVLIEYKECAGHDRLMLVQHIAGFLRILRTMRVSYKGPIGMAMVPPPHKPSQTLWQHREALERYRLEVETALFLGKVFGVPIAILDFADEPYGHSGWYRKKPHWRRESLWHHTKEYFNRLEYELDYNFRILRNAPVLCSDL